MSSLTLRQALDVESDEPSSRRFDRKALGEAAAGTLLGSLAPRLPVPPLLGFDEVRDLETSGGRYGRGFSVALREVDRLAWVFDCHFPDDPILPGAIMLDALLQLTGFYGAVIGLRGRGRATKIDDIRFLREVTPRSKSLAYRIDVRRILRGPQILVADGHVTVDGIECVSVGFMSVSILPPDNHPIKGGPGGRQ